MPLWKRSRPSQACLQPTNLSAPASPQAEAPQQAGRGPLRGLIAVALVAAAAGIAVTLGSGSSAAPKKAPAGKQQQAGKLFGRGK